MLKGSAARPDILVLEPNVSPVVVETEVMPAATVEADATARLGVQIRTTGRTILSCVAVRLPARLRTLSGASLRREVADATDLEMVLYASATPTASSRWPRSGWLRGGVADLSLLVQSASVPPDVIEDAANELVTGVSEAAGLLEEIGTTNPGSIHQISEELRQEDGDQTRGMATTILANALVFQESLAGGPGDLASVKPIDALRGNDGKLSKSAILTEWRKILAVNYWPIFDIARRILELIPTAGSVGVMERLAVTAEKLVASRLMRSHDLTGAVFQRLIADRKFLAAFYTTPASAALLAGLTIRSEPGPSGRSWGDVDAVKALRIADFACGTGTLVSTAYQRIGQLHELAGGDAEALHPDLMAHSLIGADVLPAAAHLTASMLAGAHPTVKYEQSSILTVAYGKQDDGTVALGSLDLLDPQGKLEILAITAKAVEAMGESERETWASLPHASFDVVIMNPPFTRATGHEGKKIGIPNPMFAAFSSTEEEQKLMGEATKKLTAGTAAHGNAGEASIFLVLADRKLRPEGRLGLVMPVSLLSGDAWDGSRALLAKYYSELILISITGEDGGELSFSADTDIGECLVIGTKSDVGSKRATFVLLAERPQFPIVGATMARAISKLVATGSLRRLEDGPVGGSPIYFGDTVVGQALDAPIAPSGGWGLARIADLSLAQCAYQLGSEHRMWLPTMTESAAVDLPIKTVSQIGTVGPYHSDINGSTSSGGIRGPFTIVDLKPGSAPTYPVLWAHDAKAQNTLEFGPDSEGLPRTGKTAEVREVISQKVAAIWASASNCHFNRDFRFNSQSTGMQFTPQRCIGGRAWISILLPTPRHEKALVLWANTSMGLLLHWYYANKQQSGRGSIGVLPLQDLPVLDVTALDNAALNAAEKLFDAISQEELLPMHETDHDPVRQRLDDDFASLVLGLGAPIVGAGGTLQLLRDKLSREPSVRGQK